MKLPNFCRAILLTTALGMVAPAPNGVADEFTNTLNKARAIYQTDREAFLTDAMQLTEKESEGFWPIYRSYRADMDALGDELVKLVLEYVDVYPNVPEDRAEELLKGYTEIESKLAKKREWYLKKAKRVLPAAKVLRWAQLENRMDLALRLQLAGAVPLVPGTPAKK